MKTLFRILRFADNATWLLPFYLLTAFFHSVFRVINFVALVPVLRLLFGQTTTVPPSSVPEFALSSSYFIDSFFFHFHQLIETEGKVAALYMTSAILILSVFLSNLFLYLSNILQVYVRVSTTTRIRKRLYDHLLALDIGFFSNHRKGNILTRNTSDMQQVESIIVSSLRMIIKEPILIIAYFITLTSISPTLTLYTFLLIPISGFIIGQIARKLKIRAKMAQSLLGDMMSRIDETFSSIKIVQVFNAEKYMSKKYDQESHSFAKEQIRMEATNSLASPLSEFLGVSFVAGILLLGGNMILSNQSELDAASFILFLIIFSQVLSPAKAISNAFSNIQKGIASGERVFDVIDKQPLIRDQSDGIAIESINEGFRFEKVGFRFEDTMVLKDISFELLKGKVLALVGPSGGGKSTLASMIPRFYDPSSGSVLLDGAMLSSYSLHDLRKQIGLVTQEPMLFHDTIMENIRFGRPDATEEEVKKASKLAYATDFIEKLPMGYNTVIGDMGIKLSSGERQRITIARALLKNAPILILDEATSSLDTASEKIVKEAISNLMKNRTTLVITHRLDTIKNADEILVISDGQIVERGTHKLLLKKKGTYFRLFETEHS
jgi:subfamily B ATP-binding cassette protein MsbA